MSNVTNADEKILDELDATAERLRLALPGFPAQRELSRLVIAMAQEGCIGIIHKNMTIEQQANEVRLVKKYESGVIKDPITVSPDTSIREVLQLTRQHTISGVPVVEGEQLVGIVTNRDTRFETRYDAPVSSIMTGKDKLVTVREGAGREEVLKLLHEYRIEKVLVVNDAFELRGLITVKDIEKAQLHPKAAKDEKGRLRVAAATGVGDAGIARAEALIEGGITALMLREKDLDPDALAALAHALADRPLA